MIAVSGLLLVELVVGWPWLVATFESYQTPVWWWFVLALAADVASMGAYARMQRRLLCVGGTAVSLPSASVLAYASHSLSDTLPGGPAFSAVFSFRRMRRMGASAGVASWVIAFSGAISAAALVVIGLVAGLMVTGRTDAAAVMGYLTLAVVVAVSVRALNRRPGLLRGTVAPVVRAGNRILRADPHRGVSRVHAVIDDLTAVRIGPRDLAVTALLALVNWLLDALAFYLSLVAVGGVQASPGVVLLAYTAGMAALSVPLVPGGLGVVDAALVLGLVAGGTSPADAIAATILFRVISLGLIIGAGWVVWWFARHSPEPHVRTRLEGADARSPEGASGPGGLNRTSECPRAARAENSAARRPRRLTARRRSLRSQGPQQVRH